jgi:hypothetical protein
MSEAIGRFVGDNLFGLVTAGLSAVAIFYLKTLVKGLVASKKKHPLTSKDLDTYGAVIEAITMALVKTRSARCYILSIRNGDVQINNLHQYKLYCDYEVVADAIGGMKKHLQAIPVQDVYSCVAMYYRQNNGVAGVTSIPNTDSYIYNHAELEASTVKQMMVAAGSEITVHSVIRNKYGDVLGVVCLDYCSDSMKGFFDTNQVILIEELCATRDRLQNIIRSNTNEN